MKVAADTQKISVLSLRDHAYRYLKEMILTNQLYPGQTVVIEQLVKQMGVSHTPIREALMLLELEGLVITNRYKSLKITPITKNDVVDIYEMRILLEGWSASQIAETCEEKDTHILKMLVQEAEDITSLDDFSKLIELDIAFHSAINYLITNNVFNRIMNIINDQAVRIRSLVEASHTYHWESIIILEHKEILESILQKNSKLAREKMVLHLQSAMNRAVNVLDTFKEFSK